MGNLQKRIERLEKHIVIDDDQPACIVISTVDARRGAPEPPDDVDDYHVLRTDRGRTYERGKDEAPEDFKYRAADAERAVMQPGAVPVFFGERSTDSENQSVVYNE